jgi:hypothetical protein
MVQLLSSSYWQRLCSYLMTQQDLSSSYFDSSLMSLNSSSCWST